MFTGMATRGDIIHSGKTYDRVQRFHQCDTFTLQPRPKAPWERGCFTFKNQ